MAEYFNPEPFMIHNNTTSFDNEKSHQQDIIEITQHLEPEQYSYEFPPKSCIMALEAKDEADEFSFFDECSFTSNSTAAFMYENDEDDEDYTFDNADELLDQYLDSFHTSSIVADNQLSPLQLPAQANYSNRPLREESCDSNGTVVIRKPSYQPVRPSSFLSSPHIQQQQQQYLNTVDEENRINWDETSFVFPDYSTQQNVYPSIHPFSRRNSCEFQSDDDMESNFSSQSKVIFMKISKSHVSPPTFIHYSQTAGSYIHTDEGYDDDDDDDYCKELPIESASFFLPLTDAALDREAAAVKIQSVWRGYQCRKQQKAGALKVSHRVLAGLAHINDSIHRRNYNQLQKKLDKETAMRMAFEKTMEDMTVLMDHQHSVLHERLEQEVNMRQTYERKMDQTIAQIQPLEARLRHEAKARADMESMMSRIIDQLQDLRVQVKEQAEQKQALQLKLDDANAELRKLKTTTRPGSRLSTKKSAETISRKTTASSTPARDVQSRASVRSTTTPSRTSVRSTATPTKTPVRSTATPSRTSVRSTASPSIKGTVFRQQTTTVSSTKRVSPSRTLKK